MEHSSWGRTPGFAKLVILLQSFAILFLSFWFYQEYQNNSYLRAYLNTYFQNTGTGVIAAASITGFTLVAVLLYWRLHGANGELDEMLPAPTVSRAATHSPGHTDNRLEQHLIEMIRRSSPASTASTLTSSMPVLKRVDSGDTDKQNP